MCDMTSEWKITSTDDGGRLSAGIAPRLKGARTILQPVFLLLCGAPTIFFFFFCIFFFSARFAAIWLKIWAQDRWRSDRASGTTACANSLV